MKQLPVSVIIPVFNKAKTIGPCLESLRQQTDLPLEILVIDDGSTDKSVKLIKEFSLNYTRVKSLRQEHSGPANARNLGVRQAKGEILVFVDADMEFSPDFLSVLVQPILDGKAKGTWSGEEWVKNWDNLWARCWNFNQGRPGAVMIGNRGQRPVFRAILKTEFNRVAGFDSIGYTDDWTLVNKLGYQPKATRAKFFHYNPDSLGAVFSQAFWIGKRKYKLGRLGTILTLVKFNPLLSFISGILRSVKYREPRFVIFKLVHDWGILRGAWESLRGQRY